MIDYIIQKIHVKEEKGHSVKSLFLHPQERAFSINNILMKQFNGCPMYGLISVVFSYIYVCKMEEDIVIPANRVFYK